MTTATLTMKAAREIVGGLSAPGKMPGPSYGLPPAECATGSKLRAADHARRDAGEEMRTPCGGCYAYEGFYRAYSHTVGAAQYRRLAAVQRALDDAGYGERFVAAFVRLLRDVRWFRWHDAGDLQSVAHLALIVRIAQLTPGTHHWMPTQERAIVRAFEREHGPIRKLAPNLRVRISMPRLDSLPTPGMLADGQTYSTVRAEREMPGAHICPSRTQGNVCGSCRACWAPTPVVAYPIH